MVSNSYLLLVFGCSRFPKLSALNLNTFVLNVTRAPPADEFTEVWLDNTADACGAIYKKRENEGWLVGHKLLEVILLTATPDGCRQGDAVT